MIRNILKALSEPVAWMAWLIAAVLYVVAPEPQSALVWWSGALAGGAVSIFVTRYVLASEGRL